MSEEVINVQIRGDRGTRSARRLRQAGSIPAVLYGHGQETVNLAVPSDKLDAAIRHGSRVVSLIGAVEQTAFICDVQWDTFGMKVMHVDFTRVSATDLVTTTVQVELRGEAPGIKEGGVTEQPCHELEIELPVSEVTDRVYVSINQLHLGDVLTAGDVDLPPKAKLLSQPDLVIVQCVEPKEEVELEEGVPGGIEPEVIGQKPDEDAD